MELTGHPMTWGTDAVAADTAPSFFIGADRLHGAAANAAVADQAFGQGTVDVALSGWANTSKTVERYDRLEEDLTADIVVIGSGLAGSSLALHLVERDLAVVVLEARQPGWGASGRNAGHVLPTLRDLPAFAALPDGGKAFLDIFREHHTIPFDLTRKYGFDCDASRTGYLYAIKDQRTFDKYAEESRFWSGQQGQPVRFLSRDDMKQATGSEYYPFGVLYDDGGRVNPYLFTNAMIAAARTARAGVYGDSAAVSISAVDKRWRVGTAAGSVTADRVVFCTNAYPTDIEPTFQKAFYPLVAYALATKPLPEEARRIIMPSRATLAQAPVDMNPFVVDEWDRLICSSLPSVIRPQDGAWHFRKHLQWIHRTWPETKHCTIELEHYWTGRVALRNNELPGVFEVRPGMYGLMYFNAWGNVMAPLMGKLLAEHLADDAMGRFPLPVEKPERVRFQNRKELVLRKMLIPLARGAQSLGII